MKEDLRKNKSSAHISPSKLTGRLGESPSFVFSANFPPFDPQKENLSEKDRERADDIFKGVLKDQTGKISTPTSVGLGVTGGILTLGGGGIGYVLVTDAFPKSSPHNIDIEPVSGTGFSADGSVPEINGLPPHLQLPTAQPTPEPTIKTEQLNTTNAKAVPENKKINPEEVFDNTKTNPQPISEAKSNNAQTSTSESKANKINSEEIFDPYAKRQVITLKNVVFMTPEEYKDIVPPTIDPKHPERVNIFFPIRLAEGSGERKIVIEKRVPRLSVTGGKRVINLQIDRENKTSSNDGQFLVRSTYTITEGLMPGDKLILPGSGMISRGSEVEPDANGVLNLKHGGFRLEANDDKNNESLITFGGRGLKLKQIKDIPAATTRIEEVRIGNITATGSRLEPNPILGQAGEEIGIITKVGKDPDINGQLEIMVLSKVTGEDGNTQGGPAEIMFNLIPDGKIIIPKPYKQ